MNYYDYKYIILGAGPAGLAFANKLLEFGEDDFLVLEKEDTAGGLCRSVDSPHFPDNRPCFRTIHFWDR